MVNFADFRSDVPGIVPELSIESIVGDFATSVPDPSICTRLFMALGVLSPHMTPCSQEDRQRAERY